MNKSQIFEDHPSSNVTCTCSFALSPSLKSSRSKVSPTLHLSRALYKSEVLLQADMQRFCELYAKTGRLLCTFSLQFVGYCMNCNGMK